MRTLALAILGGLAALPATALANTDADEEPIELLEERPLVENLHGFRLGYSYAHGAEDYGVPSPHMFVVGYEITQRIIGGGSLNVIIVENLMVAGINQSLFIPTGNILLGFEFVEQLQVGAGANITPFTPEGNWIHMVAGVGYTPRVGNFNVPLHVSVIPDVNGHFRAQVTTGVNW